MQKPPSDKTHGGVEIVHVLFKKKTCNRTGSHLQTNKSLTSLSLEEHSDQGVFVCIIF